jgi:hypothetical protein
MGTSVCPLAVPADSKSMAAKTVSEIFCKIVEKMMEVRFWQAGSEVGRDSRGCGLLSSP